jgi:hypothetical protein
MDSNDIRNAFREATTKVRAGDRHQPAYITVAMTKVNRAINPKPPYPDFELCKGCERYRLTERLVRRVKGWKALNVTTA